MFKRLDENNREISAMVGELDLKIKKLKAENKIPVEYLIPLSEIYKETILPWMDEYHAVDREIEPEREQRVQDKIYDIFLLLQALED